MEFSERLKTEAKMWDYPSWSAFKEAEPEKAHKAYFELKYGEDPRLL